MKKSITSSKSASPKLHIVAPAAHPRRRPAITIVSISVIVAGLVIIPSFLFATNAHLDIPIPFFGLKEKYIQLATRHEDLQSQLDGATSSLTRSERELKRLESHSKNLEKSIVRKDTEIQALKEKISMLQDMNKFLCVRMDEERKNFDRMAFEMEQDVTNMKESLEKEFNDRMTAQQKKIEEEYLNVINESKKPYKELFYNDYDTARK